MSVPIEVTTLYATTSVSDMDRADDYRPPRQFSVVVSGMVEEASS